MTIDINNIPQYLLKAVGRNSKAYRKSYINQNKLIVALAKYAKIGVDDVHEFITRGDQLADLVSYGEPSIEAALVELNRFMEEK